MSGARQGQPARTPITSLRIARIDSGHAWRHRRQTDAARRRTRPARRTSSSPVRAYSLSAFEVDATGRCFAGVMGAALLSAIWLIRQRAKTTSENAALRGKIADLNAAVAALRGAAQPARPARHRLERQRQPQAGAYRRSCRREPARRRSAPRFLAFGRWLMPRSAAALENAIDRAAREGRQPSTSSSRARPARRSRSRAA